MRGIGVSKSILRRESATRKRESAWSAVRRHALATDKGQEEVERGKQGILLSRQIFYNWLGENKVTSWVICFVVIEEKCIGICTAEQ